MCAEDVTGGNKFLTKKSSFTTTLNEVNPSCSRATNLCKVDIDYTPVNQSNGLMNNNCPQIKTFIFGISSENMYSQLSKEPDIEISPAMPLLKTSSKSSTSKSSDNLIPKNGSKFLRQNNMSVKNGQKHPAPALTALKIQSEDSLRACHRRRQRAIRRCLLLATMQLLLNLPNYVLQLVDEFTMLRQTNRQFAVFYLYADAIFYLLYLSQYPMIAVYVRWFHNNMGLSKSTPGSQNHSRTFSNLALKRSFSNLFRMQKLSTTSHQNGNNFNNYAIEANQHKNTNFRQRNLSCSILSRAPKLARSSVKSEKNITTTSNLLKLNKENLSNTLDV